MYKHNKLLCYGSNDTIDWSYILPDDAVADYIPDASNPSGCESRV